MLVLKKQEKCSELPLQLYEDGIKKVKSRLLELHPEYECIVKRVYYLFLVKMELYKKNKKSFIVESVPKNKLMILKDKKIFSEAHILITSWSKILAAELTLKEEGCREFWNKRCEKKSKKLWFPTEIGSADLHSSSLNGSLTNMMLDSWYSTKQSINPQVKNSQKMFSPLYKYSPAEKWESEGIRAIKIKLRPTLEQKQILERWGGTTRYVYNKILRKIKTNPKLQNNDGYSLLTKQCITAKDNNIVKEGQEHNFDSFIYDWELNTPKDIRKGALRDIKKAYKTAWANLKAGNINSFGLGNRRKKIGSHQSMEIPNSAVHFLTGKNRITALSIYPTYFIKANINEYITIEDNVDKFVKDGLDRYARLKKENGEWYLCISYNTKAKEMEKNTKTCALDPGIRKFMTIYSEDQIFSIVPDKQRIKRLYNILDKFKQLRAKKLISQRSYNRKKAKTQDKLSNLVDEMHHKTINFLTKNYNSILLPSFETQEMVSNKCLKKEVKRLMNSFAFYKFRQRLEHKCKLIKNCDVTIVNEAYTSKTCGFCGSLNKSKKEIIKCKKCEKSYDRDINGSRNIYIKYVK
jgi:putative transposase